MLIVRSAGRLGNQLFVYSACQKVLKPGQKLVLFGFEELTHAFPETSSTARQVPLPRRHWWKWSVLHSVLTFLSSLAIVRRLKLSQDGSDLETTPGLTAITLFDAGFCQDERLLDKASVLKLWESERQRHRTFLHSHGLGETPSARPTYFVHVRRGDYLSHPSPEFPAVLPSSWYLEQMEHIRSNNPDARFVMFSDDLDYCQEKFGADPGITLVDADAVESLLAMSMCTGGILSASSLSWWAGYLSSEQNTGPYIAPEYWINWRSQSWGGETLHTSTFIDWV